MKILLKGKSLIFFLYSQGMYFGVRWKEPRLLNKNSSIRFSVCIPLNIFYKYRFILFIVLLCCSIRHRYLSFLFLTFSINVLFLSNDDINFFRNFVYLKPIEKPFLYVVDNWCIRLVDYNKLNIAASTAIKLFQSMRARDSHDWYQLIGFVVVFHTPLFCVRFR